MMTAGQPLIRSCEALSPGDVVEAWHDGRLLHSGRVTRILPTMGMFWILCGRTGARKLVDLAASDVVQVRPAGLPDSPGQELASS
jgi:hypothetical protein